MAYLAVRDLHKHFQRRDGARLQVLDGLSFSVEAGEFLCLLGPSGCGKSTLLNTIAGTLPMDGGSIETRDANVRYGYVFQKPLLLPWRSARGNVAFAMENFGVERNIAQTRARALLGLVGLEGNEDQFPHTLSGGMQHRVAIARALAIDPHVLLMDEPFSHLDELTARSMRLELLKIWERERKTVIFVTHNPHEAVFLADRVIVLSRPPARVKADVNVDIPRPRDYEDPAVISLYKGIIRLMDGGCL